ncbi:MAG TPA: response regulator transcription factor [Acidimicrobiales bacterium]|nr:response regulator transcription factor [Acidimicrobiales bacterium]
MSPDTPVLVVDDQAPFRAIARQVVDLTPGFEVVGEAESGEDAVLLAHRLAPAIVLMDINLPGINGIEATRRILADAPSVRVILLSTYRESDLPADALACGARRYVHKEDLEPGVLLDVAGDQPVSD